MQTKIKKWGNSLAVRIPSELANSLGLSEDSNVEMIIQNGKLVIKPVMKYTLEELVSQITEENRHDLIDFGPPMGNEIR